MNKEIEFSFEYDNEDDVLSIFDYNKKIKESIEFSEDFNVDLGIGGEVVGLEIFDVSKFLGALNEDINKDFLRKINKVQLVQADYRNNLFIAIILYSDDKRVCQQLPAIQKLEYTSPLVISVN